MSDQNTHAAQNVPRDLPDNSAAIALGANLNGPAGTPAQAVIKALAAIEACGLRLSAISRLWATPAVPSGPDYVNGCALVQTDKGPEQVLEILHEIEGHFARKRDGRWAARTLDLDLLGHGRRVLPDAKTQAEWVALPPAEHIKRTPDRLILPHPRLADRGFVLAPLAEIAPWWQPPGCAVPIAQLARNADCRGMRVFA